MSVTIEEMKKLEHDAMQQEVSLEELMENAGKKVFEVISQKFDLENKRIIIFAGQGNNAGDGLVTARYFQEAEFPVVVLFFGYEGKLSEEGKENFRKIQDNVVIIQINTEQDLKHFNFQKGLEFVLVDAILGTGINGPVREPASLAIKLFNSLPGQKASIDIPSGMNCDTGIGELVCDTDLVICLHDIKQGLIGMKNKVEVVDIGLLNHNTTLLETDDMKIEKL
jgi:hydroxyethylthiazole kinase-like uncharacterized protein yjeF